MSIDSIAKTRSQNKTLEALLASLSRNQTRAGREVRHICIRCFNPLVSTFDSHIKDTTDFLNKLANLRKLPNDAILVTLDVSSLYTNIPHNQGIDECCHFLDTRSNKHIPTETLCDLLRMILTMNNFTFNHQHYLQIHGTAMGINMASSIANLFLGMFETNALTKAPYWQPHTW